MKFFRNAPTFFRVSGSAVFGNTILSQIQRQVKVPCSQGLVFPKFQEQKKRSQAGRDWTPALPPSKSNRGRRASTSTPRFFSFPSGLAFGEERLRLFFVEPRSRDWARPSPQVLAAALKFGPLAATDPGEKNSFSSRGRERKRRTKSSATCPLPPSKGGGKGNAYEPHSRAPARAAFKLRFHHLSQGAAANGTRARRPANHRRASSGRRPMAARLLGAWAKRILSPGRGVWAGVGADSWLGCTGPHLSCRGFCVRLWLGFVCAGFRWASRRQSRPGAVRLGGGSAALPIHPSNLWPLTSDL